MNLTKQTRDKLCEASLKIWGSKNAWQKRCNKQPFLVPVSQTKELPKYVRGTNQQIMKLETALARNLIKREAVTETTSVVYRASTPEEMLQTLELIIERGAKVVGE